MKNILAILSSLIIVSPSLTVISCGNVKKYENIISNYEQPNDIYECEKDILVLLDNQLKFEISYNNFIKKNKLKHSKKLNDFLKNSTEYQEAEQIKFLIESYKFKLDQFSKLNNTKYITKIIESKKYKKRIMLYSLNFDNYQEQYKFFIKNNFLNKKVKINIRKHFNWAIKEIKKENKLNQYDDYYKIPEKELTKDELINNFFDYKVEEIEYNQKYNIALNKAKEYEIKDFYKKSIDYQKMLILNFICLSYQYKLSNLIDSSQRKNFKINNSELNKYPSYNIDLFLTSDLKSVYKSYFNKEIINNEIIKIIKIWYLWSTN